MPVVNGRLTCCSCGADLGDADDPYRDPDCLDCLNRENDAELDYDPLREQRCDYPEHHSAGTCWCVAPPDDIAECGVCGEHKRVCCDGGYTDNADGTVTHSEPVCVDCCGPHPHYGAGYERADCDQ